MTKVSVIIPAYNCAQRLMHALESVAAQTYPRESIETLVIDDGSSDDTAERVAAYAAASALNIRYVRQDNAGPAAARNHGMRLAGGDAIAFLDADDWWQPGKLQQQVPLLQGPVGLVYCANSFVDAEGAPLENYVRHVQMLRGDILLPLFCEFFLLTSAVVLSRTAMQAVGYFDEKLPVGEDYEYFLRLAQRFQADYVAQPLLVRCVRPDSLSRRDYVLDARVDLSTLTHFVQANPDFSRRHRTAIKQRMGRYRYDFAYRLLADHRRSEALSELWLSLQTQPSLTAARTLVRALLTRERRDAQDAACTG